MGKQIVDILIPVSAEAASWLRDDVARRKAGAILSALVGQGRFRGGGGDPLSALLDEIGRKAMEEGLTDQDIDAELAAYNAERRV
ncbi:hypothetical protein JHL17_18350 [Azospirillum sp. YIM B02556]|uniref:Uncharacterized protein n=1 Tax=Azospirillum endophyticum TaxID=2800326 RepID=A0ABS1F7J6_9PROT|nr:hypothetical protein [Azospirillum endophyticum]MBK1839374.1 hypothetical protein [Azospirillum endophyticum]